MKSDFEICERMREIEEDDPFGFESASLVQYLGYEAAQEHLKEGVTKEQWDKVRPVKTRDIVLLRVHEYLPFAWEKANGCRKLSVTRSLYNIRAWLWLMGWDDLASKMFPYRYHGKPQFVAVSELVGFDWQKWDNGNWTDNDNYDGITAEEGLRDERIVLPGE